MCSYAEGVIYSEVCEYDGVLLMDSFIDRSSVLVFCRVLFCACVVAIPRRESGDSLFVGLTDHKNYGFDRNFL